MAVLKHEKIAGRTARQFAIHLISVRLYLPLREQNLRWPTDRMLLEAISEIRHEAKSRPDTYLARAAAYLADLDDNGNRAQVQGFLTSARRACQNKSYGAK